MARKYRRVNRIAHLMMVTEAVNRPQPVAKITATLFEDNIHEKGPLATIQLCYEAVKKWIQENYRLARMWHRAYRRGCLTPL
jgi:hypothetical protein